MASITRRLLLYAGPYPPRIPAQYITPRVATQWQRPFSSTTPVRSSKDKGVEMISKPGEPVLSDSEPAVKNADVSASMAAEDAPENISKAEDQRAIRMTSEQKRAAQLEKLAKDLEALDPSVLSELAKQGKQGLPWHPDMKMDRDEDFEIEEPERWKSGFWAEGEESLGPDEDFFGDDITSHGHGELEQHRELREYARLIAWELPLLNQLARPFELPTAATPFRFRYTSYLGESHPATNKVVVEFCASDMPNLSDVQKSKLIKLAGPRYNPETDIIKMSCELYDTQAQNKRFLGDTISKLLAEARDLKDDFADVPFDFRHHKPKKRYEFPKEWVLTQERKKYLEEKRARTLRLEDERLNNGKLTDGKKIIENALPYTMPTPEPVLVGGPRGKQLR